MKTNSTLKPSYFYVLLALVLFGFKSYAQPDYTFNNSILESGKDKEVGAQYRFPNVKPGFDALVTIDFISDDVKIVDFDDNKNGGFDEAFQPRIQAKGKTKGYAEFTISFVYESTIKPAMMSEVPAASIDVDGSGGLSEYDEYLTPAGYFLDYDMVGTELGFTYGASSVIGKNIGGKEKTAIDTVAKEAMFGLIYPKITSFTVRIGLDNQANGTSTRQRSVYFKRFFFPNSFLPINNLLSFKGSRNTSNSVALNWTMNTGHEYTMATIEKSLNGSKFTSIGETSMYNKTFASYTDNTNTGEACYYRLRMTDKSGKSSYSTVLFIRGNGSVKMGVSPTIVSDNTNVNYQSSKAGVLNINVFDLNGRLVMQKNTGIEAGMNSISINGLSAFSAGQYVVVAKTSESTNTQRIQVVK